MKTIIYLRVKNAKGTELVRKFNSYRINIENIWEEKDDCIIKVTERDYQKIEKNIFSYDYSIIRYSGKKHLELLIKNYSFHIIFILLGILTVIVLSNLIISVEVKTNNADLKTRVNEALRINGIKPLTFRKSFSDIKRIKKKIKNDNKDTIEWLEITRTGMKYVVNVEKRIIKKERTSRKYCNVYAAKDGIIKKILIKSGVAQVEINDYVKKDDLIINGSIIYNENEVARVCANGKIYAEVWYNANIKYPAYTRTIKKTGKVRYNISIEYNNKKFRIFRDRIENYIIKRKKLFNIYGVKIFLNKDYEVVKKIKKLNKQEIEARSKELIREKILEKLNKEDYIVKEKILQKEANDSTINMSIFIVTYENIAAIKEE